MPTIKFFKWDLDVANLKKILDFYAWANIFNLIVLIPMYVFLHLDFILGPGSLSAGYLFHSIVFVIIGSCFYFFRYSPYMHGLLVSVLTCMCVTDTNQLLKFAYDPYLIDKLSLINFQNNLNYMHYFFTECMFRNISYCTTPILFYSIFFYFAYSYKKLNKHTN